MDYRIKRRLLALLLFISSCIVIPTISVLTSCSPNSEQTSINIKDKTFVKISIDSSIVLNEGQSLSLNNFQDFHIWYSDDIEPSQVQFKWITRDDQIVSNSKQLEINNVDYSYNNLPLWLVATYKDKVYKSNNCNLEVIKESLSYTISFLDQNTFELKNENLNFASEISAELLKQIIINKPEQFFNIVNANNLEANYWERNLFVSIISSQDINGCLTANIYLYKPSSDNQTSYISKTVNINGFKYEYDIKLKSDNFIVNNTNLTLVNISNEKIKEIIIDNLSTFFNITNPQVLNNQYWIDNLSIISLTKVDELNGSLEVTLKLKNANNKLNSSIVGTILINGFTKAYSVNFKQLTELNINFPKTINTTTNDELKEIVYENRYNIFDISSANDLDKLYWMQNLKIDVLSSDNNLGTAKIQIELSNANNYNFLTINKQIDFNGFKKYYEISFKPAHTIYDKINSYASQANLEQLKSLILNEHLNCVFNFKNKNAINMQTLEKNLKLSVISCDDPNGCLEVKLQLYYPTPDQEAPIETTATFCGFNKKPAYF